MCLHVCTLIVMNLTFAPYASFDCHFWKNENIFAVEKECDASWIQVLAVTCTYVRTCIQVPPLDGVIT